MSRVVFYSVFEQHLFGLVQHLHRHSEVLWFVMVVTAEQVIGAEAEFDAEIGSKAEVLKGQEV